MILSEYEWFKSFSQTSLEENQLSEEYKQNLDTKNKKEGDF